MQYYQIPYGQKEESILYILIYSFSCLDKKRALNQRNRWPPVNGTSGWPRTEYTNFLKTCIMDIYEEAVLGYITHDRKTFVIPQFSIPSEPGTSNEWSCPDFVAICPPDKKCYVIEVSTASNLNSLLGKVKNQENQWIEKLRKQLTLTNVITNDWEFVIKIFVRDELVDYCNKWIAENIQDRSNIIVEGLEKTFTPWNWKW